MTATDERQSLSQFAEEHGWRRREVDRNDIYLREATRIQVLWRGTSAISGSAQYKDDTLMTYTRDLARVQDWLSKP